MQSITLPSIANEITRIAEPYSLRPLLSTTQIRSLESSYAKERLAQINGLSTQTDLSLFNTPKHQKLQPTLMESAGKSLAKLCLALAPNSKNIWIACGPGNNGGDGLVAAVELQKLGKKTYVSVLGKDIDHLTDLNSDKFGSTNDRTSALQLAIRMGIELHREPPKQWDFAIDALLGIGLDQENPRPITGTMANWLSLMNTSESPVLCVDTPSGLYSDTGQMSAFTSGSKQQLIHPNLNMNQKRFTLTFLGLKPGLFTGMGKDFAGEIWFDSLAHNHSPTDLAHDPEKLDYSVHLNAEPPLIPRLHNSHKGTFSDVIVIGGAKGMQGAAVLASTGALHMGAGRVFLCLLDEGPSPYQLSPALMTRFPKDLPKLGLPSATTVCGCGGGKEIAKYLEHILCTSLNLVLDADALNAVAQNQTFKDLLISRDASSMHTVLTPHPLEAARLLGITVSEIQADRIQCAHRLAEHYRCTVVLKGSGSVIAQYRGKKQIKESAVKEEFDQRVIPPRIRVNPTGCALLATAGTGDVLAGMIGSLLAQQGDTWTSACEAVYLHGRTAQDWEAKDSFDAELLANRVSYPRISI